MLLRLVATVHRGAVSLHEGVGLIVNIVWVRPSGGRRQRRRWEKRSRRMVSSSFQLSCLHV